VDRHHVDPWSIPSLTKVARTPMAYAWLIQFLIFLLALMIAILQFISGID
jgi:hypothetical protein